MEKNTQFRIENEAELIQAYNHFRNDWFAGVNLDEELFIYRNYNYNYIKRSPKGNYYLYPYDKNIKEISNPLNDHKMPNKYNVNIKGVDIDIYDILDAHNVRNPALQHLVKKCLHGGVRGHKSREQDLKDIIASAKRAYELEFQND